MKRIELSESYYITAENIKKAIVGKRLTNIRFNEDNLILVFGDEYLSLGVDGDCCSTSYFYDFYGVAKVLGREVEDFKEIELDPTDLKASHNGEVVSVYGYKIVCKGNPDDYFDTTPTAVFSFRNDSNGYYGGSLENGIDFSKGVPEITKDVYNTQEI
jgi:hypothetical protein